MKKDPTAPSKVIFTAQQQLSYKSNDLSIKHYYGDYQISHLPPPFFLHLVNMQDLEVGRLVGYSYELASTYTVHTLN